MAVGNTSMKHYDAHVISELNKSLPEYEKFKNNNIFKKAVAYNKNRIKGIKHDYILGDVGELISIASRYKIYNKYDKLFTAMYSDITKRKMLLMHIDDIDKGIQESMKLKKKIDNLYKESDDILKYDIIPEFEYEYLKHVGKQINQEYNISHLDNKTLTSISKKAKTHGVSKQLTNNFVKSIKRYNEILRTLKKYNREFEITVDLIRNYHHKEIEDLLMDSIKRNDFAESISRQMNDKYNTAHLIKELKDIIRDDIKHNPKPLYNKDTLEYLDKLSGKLIYKHN